MLESRGIQLSLASGEHPKPQLEHGLLEGVGALGERMILAPEDIDQLRELLKKVVMNVPFFCYLAGLSALRHC
ncbi:unnamed protein product [Bursaphelenchus xylophilus]|uniref:(pine wood nematode) hypothetical protein n=1 Tax=Bursaphelenchus xylophilus TaxID=6326 RepID=A0A1I7RVG5_BURXY|nr:unnamed protein product [Bursaphelenchus xylophilus]CAG9104106.1 unnamed protein product [Bursaphelenchus xylophilus]